MFITVTKSLPIARLQGYFQSLSHCNLLYYVTGLHTSSSSLLNPLMSIITCFLGYFHIPVPLTDTSSIVHACIFGVPYDLTQSLDSLTNLLEQLPQHTDVPKLIS